VADHRAEGAWRAACAGGVVVAGRRARGGVVVAGRRARAGYRARVHVIIALFAGQPAPPPAIILATGLLALVAVLPWRVWRLTRYAVTIAHEGGHALVAVLSGRRLSGIRLHSDTSGLTVSRGKPTGPGMVLTGLAGYVAPPLLGLGGAALLTTGRIALLLWISLVPLAVMFVMVRNLFGAVALAAVIGMLGSVAYLASSPVQSAFAYLMVWFLLVGGVRPVVELQRKRRRGEARDSDADQLARLTRIPGLMWVVFFGAVALAALGLGGWLLVGGLTGI